MGTPDFWLDIYPRLYYYLVIILKLQMVEVYVDEEVSKAFRE